jgi:anti-sigma-K factor RskA
MDKRTFCGIDEYVLEEYVDNTLSRPEKLLIEAHIKNCADCRKYVTRLKLLIWDLEQAGSEQIEIPERIKYLNSNIWDKISSADNSKKSNTRLIFGSSVSAFRSAFAFTSYFFPTAKTMHILPGTMKYISSAGGKLTAKALNKGSSYLKKSYAVFFGGRL